MSKNTTLKGKTWMVFSEDTPESKAREIFTQRTGTVPQQVMRAYGRVYVGPLPDGWTPRGQSSVQAEQPSLPPGRGRDREPQEGA